MLWSAVFLRLEESSSSVIPLFLAYVILVIRLTYLPSFHFTTFERNFGSANLVVLTTCESNPKINYSARQIELIVLQTKI